MIKFLLLFILLFMVGCNYEKNDIIGESVVYVNESITLTVSNSSVNDYSWDSSDLSIAKVIDGEVFGISKGEVIISIKSNDMTLSTHNIEVLDGAELTIFCDSYLFINQTTDIVVNSNWANDVFTYASKDETIATVDNKGVVTGIKEGEATIYVRSINHGYEEVFITIIKSYTPSSIEIINLLDVYYIDKSPYKLEAIALPSYASQDFKWEISGNKAVIDEDSGEITLLDEGKVYIICRSASDFSTFKVVAINVEYSEDVEVLNVLFIGNSLTYVNDIPRIVEGMRVAKGFAVNCTGITNGGYTLEDHLDFNISKIANELFSRHYSYIIIQEQSYNSFINYQSFLDSVKSFKEIAFLFEAELLLYQTWTYRDGAPLLDQLFKTRDEMHLEIVSAYQNAADFTNTRIIRVGEIFYQFMKDNPEISLYMDDIHANLAGSYLSSCVHYISIFNDSVVNNPYETLLDADLKLKIQQFVTNFLENNS
jgi:hypothetical protein